MQGGDMIDPPTAERIRRDAQAFWDSEVTRPYFQSIAQGKEIGHR
jgi:hypothetical protein